MEDKKINLQQRILKVMHSVPYLKRDVLVEFNKTKYNAVSHDKVVSSVRHALIENGIIIVQELKSSDIFKLDTVKYGKVEAVNYYKAIFKLSFINSDNKDDFISIENESHIIITDDKSTIKASSYSMKNAILKMFLIETGENEELHNLTVHNSIAVEIISDTQAKELKELCLKVADTSKFLAYYSVNTFEAFPVEKYKEALEALNKKLADSGIEKIVPIQTPSKSLKDKVSEAK